MPPVAHANAVSAPSGHQCVRAWIHDWNDNPKPFIWTKTAEQILAALGRLIARIKGEGH
jgi:hypothetical protein